MGFDQTALIHLYRGELQRLATYRVRLDTTTNWAIGVVVAVTTFALGQPEAPHTILILPYALTATFAFIESRRFQELEVYRARVRVMEQELFAPLVDGEARRDGWGEALSASLRDERPTLPLVYAFANRVRRNYLWLVFALYGAWWMKLWLVSHRLFRSVLLLQPRGLVLLGASIALLVPWVVVAFIGARHDRFALAQDDATDELPGATPLALSADPDED